MWIPPVTELQLLGNGSGLPAPISSSSIHLTILGGQFGQWVAWPKSPWTCREERTKRIWSKNRRLNNPEKEFIKYMLSIFMKIPAEKGTYKIYVMDFYECEALSKSSMEGRIINCQDTLSWEMIN